MSTLNELKEWIEQGGKICRESSKGLVYDLNEECELRDSDNGVATYQSLIASDWVKVEEESKRWKPAEEEYYYFVSDEYSTGIGNYCWHNDLADYNLYKAHNCFNTRQKAAQAHDVWLAERELRSLADGGEYNILYHKMENRFYAEFLLTFKSPYTFSSQQKAERVIKRLGEDKLKLIFGVK